MYVYIRMYVDFSLFYYLSMSHIVTLAIVVLIPVKIVGFFYHPTLNNRKSTFNSSHNLTFSQEEQYFGIGLLWFIILLLTAALASNKTIYKFHFLFLIKFYF